jgi:hypothetical protein
MKKTSLLFAVAFVFSFLLPACTGGGAANSPSKAVEKSYSYLMDKEYDKLVKMYATQEGKLLTEEEKAKVKAMLASMGEQQFAKKEGLKSIAVLKETLNEAGDKAEVEINQVFGNGTDENDKIKLIKIEGNWYMLVASAGGSWLK